MYSYQRQRNINPSTVIITGTLFVFSTFSLVSSLYRRPSAILDEWDLIIFSQNWPLSVCASWKEKSKTNTCQLPINDTWTIHGLWPTKLGVKVPGPSFCDPSKSFDPQAIYGILNKLNRQWTPVEKHKKSTSFWSHEWSKHGSCASALPALSSEFLYFYQGLQWNVEYNMTDILNKVGITPGNSYNLTDIWTGIKHIVNKNPTVVCYHDVNSNKSTLLEIRICFDKSLTLVDCNGTIVGGKLPGVEESWIANFTNCPLEKLIDYPKSPIPSEPQPLKNNKKEYLMDLLKTLQLLQWGTF